MRRIQAISVLGQGPVHAAFLELADVTVLTGRNDSGKTRLLRLIEAALNEPHAQGYETIDVFGRASEDEVAAFVHADEPDEEEIELQAMPFAPFREALELSVEDGEVPLAVRTPISRVSRLPAWRYGRRPADLPELARTQIEAAISVPAVLVEPSTIEYLGGVDPVVLPEAVAVPSAPELVQAEVTVAAAGLSRALRYLAALWEAAEEHLGPLEGLPAGNTRLPEGDEYYDVEAPPTRWLLDESPEAVVLHDAAIASREALQLLINHLLPDFIADVYKVEVVLPPVISIAAGGSVDLALAAVDSSTLAALGAADRDPLNFPIAEAASGYTVWLQLAIREACARANILARILMDGALRVQELTSLFVEDASEAQSGASPAAEVRATVELALARLSDPQGVPAEKVTEGFQPVAWRPDQLAEDVASIPEAWMPVFRPRLYLLDEPEQRLHPALQRRAARWLADLMREWRSQCLLATHSTAFMDVPGDTRVYELSRSGQSTSVNAINIAELTPHAQLAREMGLDRGELLSRWRAYLFVEGLADVAVMEEFFKERLESSRIRVLSVHGHRHHAGLLDMFILAEATAAPIAALLDGISETERTPYAVSKKRLYAAALEIKRLRAASAPERAAAMSEPGRDRHCGPDHRPRGQAKERNIDILTIEAPDIFDLLDDDVIRRTSARTSTRQFPGHRAARDAFTRGKGPRTTSSAIRELARAMKRRGLPPPAPLEDAVTRVEQGALSAELRPT